MGGEPCREGYPPICVALCRVCAFVVQTKNRSLRRVRSRNLPRLWRRPPPRRTNPTRRSSRRLPSMRGWRRTRYAARRLSRLYRCPLPRVGCVFQAFALAAHCAGVLPLAVALSHMCNVLRVADLARTRRKGFGIAVEYDTLVRYGLVAVVGAFVWPPPPCSGKIGNVSRPPATQAGRVSLSHASVVAPCTFLALQAGRSSSPCRR